MDEQNLLESLTRRSAETSSASEFAFGGPSSFNYENAEAKTILKKDYMSKEKADRLQEMQREQASVEKEFPNELFDICGADRVEEVQMIDIPFWQRENKRGGRAHCKLRQSKRAQKEKSSNLRKHHERRENPDENGSKSRSR